MDRRSFVFNAALGTLGLAGLSAEQQPEPQNGLKSLKIDLNTPDVPLRIAVYFTM